MPKWNLPDLDQVATEVWSFNMDGGIINSACWSPDGSLIVVNCFKNFLIILDGSTGEEIIRIKDLEYSKSQSFWSGDGRFLFSHIRHNIRVWETKSWREINRIEVGSYVKRLAVDPQGLTFATRNDIGRGLNGYGRVDVWRAQDGLNLARIETRNYVSGISLSPFGQIAIWSNRGEVKIWNVAKENSVVQTLTIDKGLPETVIWSPSGSSIVVITNILQLYVFDADTAEQLSTQPMVPDPRTRGHLDSVTASGFSSDETWFATKAKSGKVLVWETSDWQPVAIFQSRPPWGWKGSSPPVLAIMPDEPVLLTENDDCNGLIAWRLSDSLFSVQNNKPHRKQSRRNGESTTIPNKVDKPRVISLAELERLGEFTRMQQIQERLLRAEREFGPLRNYPLFPGWSQADAELDVFHGSEWKRVRLKAWDQKQIAYEYQGLEQQLIFHPDSVAPAGHFTEFHEDEFHISKARLSTDATFPDDHWQIVSSELIKVEWPYLQLRVTKYPPNDIVGRSSSSGNYTFHVADPRLIVNGERRPQPLFNTPIAVSHRWLEDDHPDPSGLQYHEFIQRAKQMKLHPMQPFLIDYCSLPQKPWSHDEKRIFVSNLKPFHEAFSGTSIILHHGADDYHTRAWCMLELLLIAVQGKLASGAAKIQGTPELPPGLEKTWEEAENYAQLTYETMRNLAYTINASSDGFLQDYLSDNRMMAFQQAKERRQRQLLRSFDELKLRYEPDRRHIKKILRELVFRAGPF